MTTQKFDIRGRDVLYRGIKVAELVDGHASFTEAADFKEDFLAWEDPIESSDIRDMIDNGDRCEQFRRIDGFPSAW